MPADASVVAYADVQSIMNSELRQRFKQSVPMPMGEEGQREFFEKTGIDIENDIDYVVAAATALPGGGSASERRRRRARPVRYREARGPGARAWRAGPGIQGKAAADPPPQHLQRRVRRPDGTAAPPRRTTRPACLPSSNRGSSPSATSRSVQRAIDAQLSAHSITSNNEMMESRDRHRRRRTTRGRWVASTSSPARRSCPTRSRRKIPPVKWLAVAGHVNGGVSAQLRAEANDDQAAENLRGVLNGVISLARLQGQNDPKLTSLIQSLQLTGSGKTVRLSFSVPAEIFELMQPKAQPFTEGSGSASSRN